MSEAAVAHHSSTGIDSKKILMWAFIGSECMLFGILISTYLAYKGRSLVGPFPDDVLNIPLTSVSTFVLLVSSLAIVIALDHLGRGQVKWAAFWTFATAALGLGFLGFQAYEFTEFVHHGLKLNTNLFGATFFTLTGFHGGHVSIGVLVLITMGVQMLRGKFGAERSGVLEVVGLYWHFVDVVWIVIFTLVYLLS